MVSGRHPRNDPTLFSYASRDRIADPIAPTGAMTAPIIQSAPRNMSRRKEVQHILADVHGATERLRGQPRRVRIVSVEAVAEKWLVPRLADLEAAHPGIAIELETDHRGVTSTPGLHRRDRGATPRRQTPRHPNRGNAPPRTPHRRVQPDPARGAWAAQQPRRPPRLAPPLGPRVGHRPGILVCLPEPARAGPHQASGFRLYSMLIDAATHGLGAAIGRPSPSPPNSKTERWFPSSTTKPTPPNAAASSPPQPPDKDPKSKHHHTPEETGTVHPRCSWGVDVLHRQPGPTTHLTLKRNRPFPRWVATAVPIR